MTRTLQLQLYLFFAALLYSTLSVAQLVVPNNGFEDWETDSNGIYNPIDWETDNTSDQTSASPVIPGYSGFFSLFLTTYETGLGAYGNAWTTIPTTLVPANINCAVGYQTTGQGQVFVGYILYDNGDIVGTDFWSPIDSQSNGWELIYVDINDPGVPITDIRILVTAEVGDDAMGTAQIQIDEITMETILSVEANEQAQLKVFPNPATNQLTIDYRGQEDQVDQMRLVDMSGRIVLEEAATTRLDVSALSRGRYQLEILTRDGVVISREAVVVN